MGSVTGNLVFNPWLLKSLVGSTILENSEGDISTYAGIPTTDILPLDNFRIAALKRKIKPFKVRVFS